MTKVRPAAQRDIVIVGDDLLGAHAARILNRALPRRTVALLLVSHLAGARWSTEAARWTVSTRRWGEPSEIGCSFLVVCGVEGPLTRFDVDGIVVDEDTRSIWGSSMLEGVPNLARLHAGTRPSIVEADRLARRVVRTLRQMDRTGSYVCIPIRPSPNLDPTEQAGGWAVGGPAEVANQTWRWGEKHLRTRLMPSSDAVVKFHRSHVPDRSGALHS